MRITDNKGLEPISDGIRVNSDFLVARVSNYYNKGVSITPVMSGNGIELLKVENVTKKYEGKVVLDNISFTLKTGEILGLIGKSASGKSVLMHMIRGAEDYRPDSGRVLYHVNLCTECDAIDTPKEGGVCPVCGKPCKTEWIEYWAIKDTDPLRYRISSRISLRR